MHLENVSGNGQDTGKTGGTHDGSTVNLLGSRGGRSSGLLSRSRSGRLGSSRGRSSGSRSSRLRSRSRSSGLRSRRSRSGVRSSRSGHSRRRNNGGSRGHGAHGGELGGDLRGSGAGAVSDGQGGGRSDGVGLVVLDHGGGQRAVSGVRRHNVSLGDHMVRGDGGDVGSVLGGGNTGDGSESGGELHSECTSFDLIER